MDEPTAGDPLQFDKAEFESGDEGLACTYCQRPILDAYYEVSGQTTCEDCRGDVETKRTQGSPASRVFKAIALGSIGGLIGAGVYYGVAVLTGYELGLIAIGVGILVGIGVRMGSGGAGGRGYQWLAAAMTYVAIVSTYIPFIIEGLEQTGEETTQSEDGAGVGQEEQRPTAEPTPEEALVTGEENPAVTAALLVLFVLALALFVLAAPFLALFESAAAIMGLIIIGIGVHQAWRLNAYRPLEVEGPFELGKRDSSGPELTFGSVDV